MNDADAPPERTAVNDGYGPSRSPDGQPLYFSATQLTTADPNSYGGCPLAWWHKYVDGKRPPPTAAMTRGTEELHKPIERYYLEGVDALPPLALACKPFMPERGPDLGIERELSILGPNGVTGSSVYVAGVPIVGKQDLTHARGEYIDSAKQLRQEPHANTVEVIDWKSTSAWSYAKSGPEVAEAVQTNLYAADRFKLIPAAQLVRLSHVSSITRGPCDARKSTTLVDRERVSRRMEYLDRLGREIIDISHEADPMRVPANVQSCTAYGRKGCSHKAYCPKAFGGAGTMSIGGLIAAHKEKQMGFLKSNNPGPTVTDLQAPDVGVEIDIIAQLEAEESTKLAKVAARVVDPRVAQACVTIRDAGHGWPMLVGVAARAYGDWMASIGEPIEMKTLALAGSGKLAGLKHIDTVEGLIALGEKMATALAKQAAAHKAAEPVAASPLAAPPKTELRAQVPISILPADAPAPTPVAPPVVQTVEVVAEVNGETDRKVTVVPDKTKPAPVTTADLIAASADKPADRKAKAKTPKATGALRLFVDCSVAGEPGQALVDLQPWIDALHSTIVEYYKIDPPDMRCAQEKPCSFAGWKGVIAALARQQAAELPKTDHRVRSSEVNDVVIDALASTGLVEMLVRAAR